MTKSPRLTLRAVLLAGAAALIATSAHAQTAATSDAAAKTADTTFSIGEVVVTGRRGSEVSDVLSSVDILGGDIAQRQNVDSTFKLLGQVPGVLVTDFHQGGTNGSVSFRGFNAEGGIAAVKLLIDGVPSNSNDGYMWFLDAVTPLEINSVEVVRGTSDPRYGLLNIAGNVGLTTRQGGNYIDTKVTTGSWSTLDAQAAVGLEAGPFSQNYAIGYRKGDGYRDHGESTRQSISGKWYLTGDKIKVGAVARYFRAEGDDSGFLSPAQAATNPRQSLALNATDGRNRRGGEYSLHADGEFTDQLSFSGVAFMSQFNDTRFFRIAPTVLQQERNLNEAQHGASGTLRYKPQVDGFFGLTIEGGADILSQRDHHQRWLGTNRVRSSTVFNRQFDLDVYGGFIQAVIEPTSWLKITPAWRLDKVDGTYTNRINGLSYPNNDYGTISSPKLSAVVTPWDGVSLYANYGRTFQIGLGVSSFIVPPQVTNTDPSTNEGWETGVKIERGPVQARLAVWRQTATGEILLQNFTGDFVNLGSTRRQGFDAQVNLRLSDKLNGWASYSYQEGTIVIPDPATPTNVGHHIDHVPPHLLTGGIDYRPIERLRLSTTWLVQSKYELDATNSRGRYGDRHELNAEVGWKINPKVEVSAEVRNLTDDKSSYVYWDPTTSTALHSPHDGRAVYVSLRASY